MKETNITKEEFRKVLEQSKEYKEYEEWENSIEGVLYNLTTIGDRTIDDDKDRVLIAKTLLKLPKEIREKVIDEVFFVIMKASGTVENLRLSKTIKKEKLE